MKRLRRFVGLIWGPDGQVELVRDWGQYIYSCPCGAARLHVRLPRYGEQVGRRFVLEEVRK